MLAEGQRKQCSAYTSHICRTHITAGSCCEVVSCVNGQVSLVRGCLFGGTSQVLQLLMELS